MRARLAGAVLLLALSTASCGFLDDAKEPTEKKPNMDMQEAAEFADSVISDTLRAVEPPVRWTHRESTEGACTDSGNDTAGAGNVTRRAAVMTIISDERRGRFLGLVERHWKQQDYEITGVRDHERNPAVFAATPGDFRMSLEVGYKGQVFLDVVTPCVTRSEVAPPRTEANGEDYSGQQVPSPDRTSDFWSARTPPPHRE